VTQPIEKSQEIWLTRDALGRLQDELVDLTGRVRSELSRRIGEARDEGDLKENGGYQAAKEEQGKVEARIRQLDGMLEHVRVGKATDDGVVAPGTLVTVAFPGDPEHLTFLLGSRENVGAGVEVDVYSPQSSLGDAVLGRRKGDTVSYKAPNGKNLTVEVVDVVPFTD